MNIPSGNVTFLFTDIEGSTKHAQQYPDALPAALEKHNLILREAIESNNGFVFEIIGDAFFSAFENAEDAVKASVEIQTNLSKENWDEITIKIRIGIHSGKAEWNGKRYMGYITVARASRVMSVAYGEQIIISKSTFELIKNKPDNLAAKKISFLDLGERRLKDVIQPLRLFQIEYPGLRQDFPPLKTLDARPNNLPVQLTNFIGREKEIAGIRKKIYGCRLITFIGPGGTGKTRLAMQVAAEIIDEFTNGVWIAELAPLSDPSLIPLTIARSFGVKIPPGEETETALINYLNDKEILLILDNCEHLIDECTQIAVMLLKKCSGLKIIASSREALKCEGEVIHRVLSLAHPEPSENNTPQELSQYEAVRLFIERALAVNPNFRVTNENAPALAQICFHLDGMPLAIELAAARIKILTVEKICEKLDDRFRLLSDGKRTALPRQQTLRAMIDWSYDLLTEKEKLLFQRLSVFSGGWTLEAAEEVCSDDVIEIYEILDTHSNLLDKSLITTIEISGAIRFDMLESIKQYAKEKLETKYETAGKHLNYFKKLADPEKLKKEGIEQNDWVKLIDAELDNMRRAIQWSSENKQEDACQLISDITNFWNIKGYFLEGRRICTKFLSKELSVSEYGKAKVLYSSALVEANLGNMNEAERLAKESLNIFRKTENKFEIAKSLNVIGISLNLSVERTNEAKEYYEEALSIFRELGIEEDEGTALYNLSFIFQRTGNNDKALEYKLKALNIFKKLDITHQISLILANLGVLEYKNKNFDKALSYSEESLSNSYQIGDNYLISVNLANLGCVYSGLKQFEKAVGLLEESIVIMKQCGYKSSLLVALMYLGEVKSDLGDDRSAINLFNESIQIGNETNINFYLGNNFYRLGISYFNLKDFESSLKYFSFLKIIADNNNDPIGQNRLDNAEEYRNKLKDLIGSEKYENLAGEILKLNKEDALSFALSDL